MVNGGTHQSVDINQIELDRSNPRIVKFLEMHGDNPTPEQISLLLAPAVTKMAAQQALKNSNNRFSLTAGSYSR